MKTKLIGLVCFLLGFALGAQDQEKKVQSSKSLNRPESKVEKVSSDVQNDLEEEQAKSQETHQVSVSDKKVSDKNAAGTYEQDVRNGVAQKKKEQRKGYYISEEEIAEMNKKKKELKKE